MRGVPAPSAGGWPAGRMGGSGLGRGGICSPVLVSAARSCLVRGVAELQVPSCPGRRVRAFSAGTRERSRGTGPRGWEKWDLRLEAELE